MRYVPSNRYIVYNALRELGGKSTSDKILSKINEDFDFSIKTLSHYIGRLVRSGQIQKEKIKGKRLMVYSIPKVDLSNIDNKTWIDIVFLIFKKGLSFEEISSVLNIKQEIVKEIFTIECINNQEMKIFEENEKNKNKFFNPK